MAPAAVRGGATYYAKTGGAAAVAGASGGLRVTCNTGAVDVYFYVTGNPGSSVPLTVSVSYA